MKDCMGHKAQVVLVTHACLITTMEEPSNLKRSRAGPSGPATESATEQEGRGKRRKEDRTLSSGASRQGLVGLVRMVGVLWSWRSLWLLLPKV